MAVDKELLQLDLYGLLGIGEKASEKEVRAAAGEARAGPVPQERRPLPRAGGGWGAGRPPPPCCRGAGRLLRALSRTRRRRSGRASPLGWVLSCGREVCLSRVSSAPAP